jgi:hypothetical protein
LSEQFRCHYSETKNNVKAKEDLARRSLTKDLELREQQKEAYLTLGLKTLPLQQQPGSQADAAVLDEGIVSTVVIYFYTKLKEQCQEIF